MAMSPCTWPRCRRCADRNRPSSLRCGRRHSPFSYACSDRAVSAERRPKAHPAASGATKPTTAQPLPPTGRRGMHRQPSSTDAAVLIPSPHQNHAQRSHRDTIKHRDFRQTARSRAPPLLGNRACIERRLVGTAAHMRRLHQLLAALAALLGGAAAAARSPPPANFDYLVLARCSGVCIPLETKNKGGCSCGNALGSAARRCDARCRRSRRRTWPPTLCSLGKCSQPT